MGGELALAAKKLPEVLLKHIEMMFVTFNKVRRNLLKGMNSKHIDIVLGVTIDSADENRINKVKVCHLMIKPNRTSSEQLQSRL